MDEDSPGRWSPMATAASGLMHAAIVLAIVYQLSPWQAGSSSTGGEPPTVELSIVQPEAAPAPPTLSLPKTPELANILPVPKANPPPPPPPQTSVTPRVSAAVPQLIQPPVPAAPEQPQAPSPPPTPTTPAKAGPDLATAPSPPAPRLAIAQPPPHPPPSPQTRSDYLLQVIGTLSRSPYIPRVRLETAPGTVVMRLTVGRDGRLIEAALTRSSGFAELDNGMMEAVRRAGPFPPPPTEGGGRPPDRYTVTVPIRFAPLEASRAR